MNSAAENVFGLVLLNSSKLNHFKKYGVITSCIIVCIIFTLESDATLIELIHGEVIVVVVIDIINTAKK